MEVDVSEWVFSWTDEEDEELGFPVISDSYVSDFYTTPSIDYDMWDSCLKEEVKKVHSKGLVRW